MYSVQCCAFSFVKNTNIDSFYYTSTGKNYVVAYFTISVVMIRLVLLRIPSSRPNPRTFPQFVRVQILGFLAAENHGFETYVPKFFHLISRIYTTKTLSKWH